MLGDLNTLKVTRESKPCSRVKVDNDDFGADGVNDSRRHHRTFPMTLLPDLMADDSGGWTNSGALVPTLNTLITVSTDYVVTFLLT